MSKKIVLWVSLIGSIIFVLLMFPGLIHSCSSYKWCGKIIDLVESLGFYIFLFPLILLFSLITYKMQDRVFKLWFKFSFLWIPVTIILPFFFPDIKSDFVFISSRGLALFAVALLYFLVSLVLITVKYISLRKSATQK